MKKAFTLAEVLITLTIIGVIAAITIPNLIQSWKKHQVEVGVKEAYSILSNAIKMSETEHGRLTETFPFNDIFSWSDEYIIPYLVGTKDISWSNGGRAYSENKPISGCHYDINGKNINSSNWCTWTFKTIILANGMTVGIENNTNSTYGKGVLFHVDINGYRQGPNRVGVDIFEFDYYSNTENSSYAPYRWAGGLLPGYASFATELNNYNKVKNDCISQGRTCSNWVMKNSWKIPDDYPIKKF